MVFKIGENGLRRTPHLRSIETIILKIAKEENPKRNFLLLYK
jgi:hypothetical protein